MHKIGKGSYGEVYRRDQFAYKYIPKLNCDDIPLDGATREIFALKHLDHPNIIKGAIRFSDDNVIIKMIYYPYTLLDPHIYNNELKLVEYMYRLIHACAYMELAGFMHRDLKPENILVGQDLIVADFSLSIWARESNYHNVQTVTYRAPEVFAKLKYTSKIDVWSVGIILYEMLTKTELALKNDESSIEILAQNIGVSKNEAYLFRLNCNCKYPTKEYKDTWSFTYGPLGDLCIKMLSFNPEYRITFTECLQHIVFKFVNKILMPTIKTKAEDVVEIIKSKKLGELDKAIEFLVKQITGDDDVDMVSEKDVFDILQR